MRKIILITAMIILIVCLGYTVYAGFEIGNLEIPSYKQIEEKSQNLDVLILEYESKNNNDLKQKQAQLTTQISEYQEQKQKYEEILKQKETDLANYDSANCYDVDFLWTRIGNYATQHDLDLEFNVSKNASDQGKTEYILADLSFIAMGEYDKIANFISDLENDERLEFEIRNFNMKMEKIKDSNGKETDKSVLKSTFTVYSVAINKSTLTQLTNNSNTENSTSTNTNANF